MRTRDISLDVIRLLACMLVVAMHSPIPSSSANGIFLSALSYFTAPCIGLFFMVSGSLLLPVKENYYTFIRRRFGKVIFPALFWTIIYVVLKIYKNPQSVDVVQTLCSIPFSVQGNGVLWFMYTLVGLYLIAPILSAWLERACKTDLQIALALWGITLCYPLLEPFVVINESNTGILYYFGGYAGYFLLGYYVKKYPDDISFPISVGISILGIISLLAIKHYGIKIDFYRAFWYLSIFVAAMCVAIWKVIVLIVRKMEIKESKRITSLSNLSFGIYLCHILVMRELLWNVYLIINISNYILQTAVVFILTFILSVLLCEFLARLPFAKFLIGFTPPSHHK